jgi:hypothetical protein
MPESIGDGEQRPPIVRRPVAELRRHFRIAIEPAPRGPVLGHVTGDSKSPRRIGFIEPLDLYVSGPSLHVDDHSTVQQRQRQRADCRDGERSER